VIGAAVEEVVDGVVEDVVGGGVEEVVGGRVEGVVGGRVEEVGGGAVEEVIGLLVAFVGITVGILGGVIVCVVSEDLGERLSSEAVTSLLTKANVDKIATTANNARILFALFYCYL